MPLIHKKNFVPTICIVYTFLSMGKLVIEKAANYTDPYYTENLLTMLVITILATFVLSLHYFIQNVPIIFVVLGQYGILLAIIMGSIWIESYLININSSAYRDMFYSFTIPYIIAAAVYYVLFFIQVKKTNEMINEIKSRR